MKKIKENLEERVVKTIFNAEPKMRKKIISIVIPAFNEERGIRQTISKVQDILVAAGFDYEIIVIDDGSTDHTFKQIRITADVNKHVKGIRFSKNFGKEAAILAGLKASMGDAVITIDADLQHPPEVIPSMFEKWSQGSKVVHAIKKNRSADKLLNRMLAWLFNAFLSILGTIDIRNSSDFKLLDRDAVKVIVNEIPEHHRFYRGLANWIGFEQTSLYFDVAPRKEGNSKWGYSSLIKLATTATVSFTSLPLRVISLLGAITLIIGFVITIETLWSKYNGTAVSGFATLEITILMVSSFLMISLGVLGEYVAKIYDEVKKRPPYIISSDCGFDDRNNDS